MAELRPVFQNIANAIREKNGLADTYTPEQMPAAIKAIEGGGGGGGDELLNSIVGRTATSIEAPGVTSVGDRAFAEYETLQSISLPNATTFGDFAFQDCYSLTTIDLPNATTFGSQCFAYCEALTTIDLPNATTIGFWCFTGCQALTDLYLRSPTLCETEGPKLNNTCKIHVPADLLDQYRVAPNWDAYESRFVAIV